jgi:large subunit ribosomal protein L13Ae
VSTRAQVIVIDAKGHLFGRLASIVAKQLLQGQHVVRNAMRRQGRGAGCVRAREGGVRAQNVQTRASECVSSMETRG